LATDTFVHCDLGEWSVINGSRGWSTFAVLELHTVNSYVDDDAHFRRRFNPQDGDSRRTLAGARLAAPHLPGNIG
jgi:hypothetical protein